MSFSRFAVVVIILTLSLSIPTRVHLRETEMVMDVKQRYKIAMEMAVDDAMDGIVETDNGSDVYLNKDYLLEQFYHTLFINLGCPNDSDIQNRVKTFIPVVLLVDKDGYYISFSTVVEGNDGLSVIGKNWTDKLPYTYVEENSGRIFNFTLGDEISVYDPYTNMVHEGRYQDLARLSMFSVDDRSRGMYRSELLCGGRFDEIRRNTIINSITESMTYYINVHNSIAQQFGISYKFSLPYVEEDDWARTIDDISMFALFQGMPYASTDVRLGYLNLYTIGGARIYKKSYYYIVPEGSVPYYHKTGCEKLDSAGASSMAHPYESAADCAAQGAYPCSDCHP